MCVCVCVCVGMFRAALLLPQAHSWPLTDAHCAHCWIIQVGRQAGGRTLPPPALASSSQTRARGRSAVTDWLPAVNVSAPHRGARGRQKANMFYCLFVLLVEVPLQLGGCGPLRDGATSSSIKRFFCFFFFFSLLTANWRDSGDWAHWHVAV